MSNYYRVLGVSRFANTTEIRQAYWSLTREIRRGSECEPDAARLAEIEHAFQVLCDTKRRRTYDSREGETRDLAGRSGTDPGDADESGDVPLRVGGFPSMLSIVPRMRTAFFSEPGRKDHAQTQRVELSPREALEGARVPVDLAIRSSCPVCGGRGEMWAELCAVCVGSGSGLLSHQLRLRVPPGVKHGTRLRFSVTPPYAPETHVELRIAVR